MPLSKKLSLPHLMRVSSSKSSTSSLGSPSSTHDKYDSTTRKRANNTNTTKKQVGFIFSTISSSYVKIDYIEPSSYELTEELCRDIWWSPEEREENGSKRKYLAHEFRATVRSGKTTIDEDYESLYESCSTMSLTQVLRSKAAKEVLAELASSDLGLRGLESKISKTVSKHRKQHVHTVLSMHQSGASEELLSVSSKSSSRASEMLARVIALLDAREASPA